MSFFSHPALYLPRILAVLAILSIVPLLYSSAVPVFLAMCFALLTMSVYKKLNAKFDLVKAIAIYTFALVFAFLIPISLAFLLLIPQIINGVGLLQQWSETGWQIPLRWQENMQELYNWLTQISQIEIWLNELEADISDLLNSIIPRLLSGSLDIAGSVMAFGWSIFLFIVLTLLFLVYANQIKLLTDRVLNLEEGMFDRFILAIRNALSSVVLGILLVAFLQGIACTVGFFLFGVPEPLFWGLLACLVAPIPVIGTFFVWGPLTVYLWFGVSPAMALGMFIWGLLVVAAVDNFTRPYFLSTGIKAPFFVLFLSLLCGLGTFGALGLILGPVLLAFSLQCITEISHIFSIEMPNMPKTEKSKKNIFKTKLINRK